MSTRYNFLIFFFFSWLLLSFHFKKSDNYPALKKLPVYLNFSKTVPDSVQDFFKVYLRAKKIELIDYRQTIELSMNAINEKVMEKLKSGETIDEKKIKELTFSSITPVYNNFSISVFRNQQDINQKIDSIHWGITALPRKDTAATSLITNTYLPSFDSEGNIFIQCRGFADTIIKRGYLN